MNPAINVHNGAQKPDQKKDISTNRKTLLFEEPAKKNKKKGDKPPMNKILKIILWVVGIIVLFIVSILGFTFYAGSAIVSAVADSANQEVTQRVESSNGQTTIYLPLQKEYGFIIRGYPKCFNHEGISNEPSTSSSCINGRCEITVAVDMATIPDNVTLFVEQGNECKAKEFKVGDIDVINYFVKMEMNDELLDALDIHSDKYTISSHNSRGHSSYQMMGTKKITLNYYQIVPLRDTLMVDKQNKARIVFE